MMSWHYWEDIGIKATLGKMKGFRPSLWIFTMKARFGWRDNSPVKRLEDDIDELEIELEAKERVNRKPPTMAEIVEKYREQLPAAIMSS